MFRSILSVMFAVGLLAACQTASEKLADSGATPYTKDELTMALSGMTAVWIEGGGYYAPDGTLDTLWKGVRETGTWEITDAGEVCLIVESWGTTMCEAYYHSADGSAITVSHGVLAPASTIQMGNKLDELAAN